MSRVSVASLGGRPRDMHSTPPCTSSLTSADMKEVMEEEGEVVTIITSTGTMTVLSARALEIAGAHKVVKASTSSSTASVEKGEKEVEKEEEAMLVSAVVAVAKIRVQPRLIAVTSWTHTSSSSVAASAALSVLSEKKKGNDVVAEEEEEEVVENEGAEDGVGGGEKKKKKKNNKKKKRKIASVSEEAVVEKDVVETETVSFVNLKKTKKSSI